jgi:chondroitin AC lyase
VWARINGALDHWLAKRYWSSNWWSNEIGVPRIMRDILVLVHDSLSPSRLAGALQIMRQLRVQNTGQGANLIWSADLGLHYGALTGNDTLARRCAKLIADEIRITTGDGIQPDYSFHQHEARLQMYQYGAAFVQSITRLAWQLHGTGWAVPEEKIDMMTDFILKGWQWMERGINTVPGTIDRSASRVNALHSADIREWIPYLCELCKQKAQQLSAIADCQNDKGENLEGFRYYPYSDFAVYQARRFSFFLKTISDRTLPSESINSENLKGGLLNSGDAYVIKNGREYFNLMPVWDWSKLPGVTAFEGATQIARRPFTGSVSDGKIGLTVMDYDMEGHHGQSMTARKCWIVHDDLVISLIAGLQRNHGESPLYTTLDQCRWQGDVCVDRPGNILKEGTHTLHGVRWIHHAGLGYIFLQPQAVQLFMGAATGTWNAINHSETAAPVTEKLFTPVMIHGMGMTPLSAGYVLAYRETAAALQSLVEKPSWTILRNDKVVQGVRFADGSVACAFYMKSELAADKEKLRAGGGLVIAVDRPCLVLVTGGHVYASDPAHHGGSLNIAVNGKTWQISLPGDGTTVTVL